MSAALFGVPLPGRCLSPQPQDTGRRFEKGDRVAWIDGAEGTVGEVTDHAVCVHWDESQWTWYPLGSVAADRIMVLETATSGDWLS
jgi:preprotein translocase subunit YajC